MSKERSFVQRQKHLSNVIVRHLANKDDVSSIVVILPLYTILFRSSPLTFSSNYNRRHKQTNRNRSHTTGKDVSHHFRNCHRLHPGRT